MTNSTVDSEKTVTQPQAPESEGATSDTFRSLRELVDFVSGKSLINLTQEDSGLAESLPFPFLAIVGQREMKLALLLGLVNPNIGGILLIGPRGTAKTTAVRSLLDLLPQVERSNCHYGCLPEEVEFGGISAICPDCAKKYAAGESLTSPDRVRLIELPLNSQLEDVIGGINERTSVPHDRMRVRRGVLARADRNLLYIDEVNMLADNIVDAILDASAQGRYTVRRGPISATYRARFLLIGSMNPEEGRLRPQILDRFGLRVIVKGLKLQNERLDAYRRVKSYQTNPRQMIAQFANEIHAASKEIQAARQRLHTVTIPDVVAMPAIKLVQKMGIESLRAEITWFETARAYAAADGRTKVNTKDLKVVAPMSLRLRRSSFITDYINKQQDEESELNSLLISLGKKKSKKKQSNTRK
ncbi:MAG: ATP-binding protein [Anaerolineae bacterium]|nr:ATP-binding protein [Anaerolineae bacterium]